MKSTAPEYRLKDPTPDHLDAAKRLHTAELNGWATSNSDVSILLGLFPRELFYPLPDKLGTVITATVNGTSELYVRGPRHWYMVEELGTEDPQGWTGKEFDSWEVNR
jgi:hypothetical protein